MSIFAIEKIQEIKGKISFYKLFKNGVCEFDEFIAEIKNDSNYENEIKKIQIIMQQLSEMQFLPDAKFKELKGYKDNIKEYEIKTHSLRVYIFHEENTGKIIVSGGRKTTQKKDITHFRNIKKEYFNSK